MKKIGLEELKVIQLDILSAVHRFCEVNNLRYSLACGSMLGAARHKGYIPWDDDIDIYLLREDYDKMVRLFPNLLEGKYKFSTLERDAKWGYPFGKVYDSRTVLVENINQSFILGVNIDVFPIDIVPNSDKKWQRYDKFRRYCLYIYERRINLQKIFNFENEKSATRNVFASVGKFLLSCFTVHFFAKCIQIIAKRYKYSSSNRVFECVQGIFQKNPFPKSLFYNRKMMPFEDREFMCFVDYDCYLTNGFGNWRQLPPKEKQISHHNFKAWWKDDNIV